MLIAKFRKLILQRKVFLMNRCKDTLRNSTGYKMLIGQDVTEIGDFLEDRERKREQEETEKYIVESFLPNIILKMILLNRIDKTKIHDRDYILSKLVEYNREAGSNNVFYHIEAHEEFIDAARNAVKSNNHRLAILLAATSIENILNIEYSIILKLRNFSNKDIKDVMRGNQIRAKIGWLMKLVLQMELDNDFKEKILRIIELRNEVVHYKALPFALGDEIWKSSSNDIEEKIENIDFDLISIPEELNKKLNAQNYILYPELDLVDDIMDVIFGGND